MNDDSVTEDRPSYQQEAKIDGKCSSFRPFCIWLLLGVLLTLKRVFSPRLLLPGNMFWHTSPDWFWIQKSWQSNPSQRQSRIWVPTSSPVGLQIPTLNSAIRFPDDVLSGTNPLAKCYNQPQRVPELWPRFVYSWCITHIIGDASRPSPGHL